MHVKWMRWDTWDPNIGDDFDVVIEEEIDACEMEITENAGLIEPYVQFVSL